MRLDSLRSLLKTRQVVTETARTALSRAIAAETTAGTKLAEVERCIHYEAEAALSLGADDGAVEAYARWLPQGRRAAGQARSALDTASQEVAAARIALSMNKASEHAVAIELEKAEAEVALTRARKAQAELDEIGSRLARSQANSDGP